MNQKWAWDTQTLKDKRFVEIPASELRVGLIVYMPGMPPATLIGTIPYTTANKQFLRTWRLKAQDGGESTLSLVNDAIVTVWTGEYADAWSLWMHHFPEEQGQ